MAEGDEVTIVGYGGPLLGASTADRFWSLLQNRSVGWITHDRFQAAAFYHRAPDQSGRSFTFAAGLSEDVWRLDATAFGLSPREAEQVDPRRRQLLEVTHDALTNACICVYVGAYSAECGARFFANSSGADVQSMKGQL